MSAAKHTPGPWEALTGADARLIAAAPDMLAVLQELVSSVAPGEGTAPILKKAYAAIAKATKE